MARVDNSDSAFDPANAKPNGLASDVVDHDGAARGGKANNYDPGKQFENPRESFRKQYDDVDELKNFNEKFCDTSGGSQHTTGKFKVIAYKDIAYDPNEEWYVDGLLPKHGLVMIFGESGSIKSFGVLDLVLGGCIGREWAGRRVEKTSCIYIAAEGSQGMKKRIKGWDIHYERTNQLPDDMQFGLIDVAPNLGMNDNDAKMLLADIQECCIKDPGVVVLDTASASMGGGDENTTGMQTLINNATMISKALKCLVILVHHIGHAATDRARGWSGQLPAMDAVLQFAKMDPIGDIRRTKVLCRKIKDNDDSQTFIISAEIVVVGTDRHGNAVTTLAIKDAVVCEGLRDEDRDVREKEKIVRDSRIKLLRAIQSKPCLHQSELAQSTDISKGQISKLIGTFIKWRLIKKSAAGGYSILTKGEKELAEYDEQQDVQLREMPF